MAIKHDAIIPYLELGRLSFHAFIPDTATPNKIGVLVLKNTNDQFVRLFEAHNQSWNKSVLVELLQTERPEVVFGLKLILTKTEVSELNTRKSEIIDYLANLEKYYRGQDAQL